MKKMEKKIKYLVEKNFPSMGEWEIAQMPEPIFSSKLKKDIRPILGILVHRESYLLLNTHLCFPEEISGAATEILLEAIEEYEAVPEILLIKEERIFKELEPVARSFDFEIVYPARFKAVQVVLRAMRETLK